MRGIFFWRFERKILTDHAGLSCFLVILLTFGVYSVHYLRAPLSWLYPGETASCIINNYNTTCSNGLRPILRSWFVPTRTAGRTGDLKLLSARRIDACLLTVTVSTVWGRSSSLCCLLGACEQSTGIHPVSSKWLCIDQEVGPDWIPPPYPWCHGTLLPQDIRSGLI